MVSLKRTVPVSKMYDMTIFIRQYLEFDMSWPLYKMFQVHRSISKCSYCFFLRCTECMLKLCFI